MIRKILLPVIAAALLGGCVTSDYAQRQGARGDYYYGQPTTEYRYYGDAGYGYGAGHPYGYYYPHSTLHYSRYYGSPYRYGNHYRAYPPYYPGHRPPVVVQPRPDHGPPPPRQDHDGRSPWRDLGELRRRQHADGARVEQHRVVAPRPAAIAPAQPRIQPPVPRERSGMGERMRRLNDTSSRNREVEP